MATFDQNTGIAWIITMHLAMHLGLGLVFTPLMTSALGSLPAHLYPHGSAVIGTMQQVAGAAGTALFITLMSLTAISSLSSGADQVTATANGVHSAFFVGAMIVSAAIVLALFVRKPKETANGHTAPAAH